VPPDSQAASVFGSLKGEDASPIKNQDILAFADFLGGGYILYLKFTPEVKKYLASKGQSDEIAAYYGLILNINGKEYQGLARQDDGSPESFINFYFFAGSWSETGFTGTVPPLKQGETYNFSFK
jgi:hypothetical protein